MCVNQSNAKTVVSNLSKTIQRAHKNRTRQEEGSKNGKCKNNNARSNQNENCSSSVTESNDEIVQDHDDKIDNSTTSAKDTAAFLETKEASEKESGARNPR